MNKSYTIDNVHFTVNYINIWIKVISLLKVLLHSRFEFQPRDASTNFRTLGTSYSMHHGPKTYR